MAPTHDMDRESHPDLPLAYIVILNWNGWRDTLACLESLRTLTYPRYRIVVVDNKSTDDSEARIRESYPNVTLLQSGANRGFAGGNNVGIRYALEHDAAYVWLLNNDALAQPESLSALIERAESDPRIGFVGSKILYANNPDVVWFAGGAILPSNARGAHIPQDAPNDDTLPPAYEPDYLTGCSLLVRRETIEHMGGLPELYFLYYEEVDWQYTARKAAWKIVYEPMSVVSHKISMTAGTDTPIAAFHNARSRMIFVRRHMPGARLGAMWDVFRHDSIRMARQRRWKAALASFRGMITGLVVSTRWSRDNAVRSALPISSTSAPEGVEQEVRASTQ